MIVGADVSHSGQCLDKYCPSMAGVVATYDKIAMSYAASARLQAKDTEVSCHKLHTSLMLTSTTSTLKT